jgi:bifunctional DNA-binding transcriptional regulator/antitoxin component of YhaV-PrlF toxin-antitoxin module
MATPRVRSVTLSSKGQITLSSNARKQLGLEKGTTIMELVVGNCVILLPENRILSEAMKGAREALSRAGVTVEELQDEIERLKEERFTRDFPNLAS